MSGKLFLYFKLKIKFVDFSINFFIFSAEFLDVFKLIFFRKLVNSGLNAQPPVQEVDSLPLYHVSLELLKILIFSLKIQKEHTKRFHLNGIVSSINENGVCQDSGRCVDGTCTPGNLKCVGTH